MTLSLAPHAFTLRQLQYAVAVAETLSFRQAAERCAVSQPSLSAQLAQLEEAIGVRLFERDRRRVLPTAAGRQILDRARRLLRDADDLTEAARQVAQPLTGALRLGVIPTVSPYLLPRLTPALRRKLPKLSVAWVEEKTPVLLERLDAGALDGALLALTADTDLFAQEVIARDVFVLATPRHHPLATDRPATAGELREADVLLLDEGHCLREQALAFCTRARAHELEFRATSLSTLVQMVAGGSGVTLLPGLAVPTETRRADVRIRPFSEPAPDRTLALLWRKRSPLGETMQALAEVFRAAYPV